MYQPIMIFVEDRLPYTRPTLSNENVQRRKQMFQHGSTRQILYAETRSNSPTMWTATIGGETSYLPYFVFQTHSTLFLQSFTILSQVCYNLEVRLFFVTYAHTHAHTFFFSDGDRWSSYCTVSRTPQYPPESERARGMLGVQHESLPLPCALSLSLCARYQK